MGDSAVACLDAHKYGSLSALVRRQVILFEPVMHLVIVMAAMAAPIIIYIQANQAAVKNRGLILYAFPDSMAGGFAS